jgi:hypothetical protein
MNKYSNAEPPNEWLIQHPFTMPTPEDREKAKWILGNVVHYRHGCSNEGDDIDTVARGLAMERRLTQATG